MNNALAVTYVSHLHLYRNMSRACTLATVAEYPHEHARERVYVLAMCALLGPLPSLFASCRCEGTRPDVH